MAFNQGGRLELDPSSASCGLVVRLFSGSHAGCAGHIHRLWRRTDVLAVLFPQKREDYIVKYIVKKIRLTQKNHKGLGFRA